LATGRLASCQHTRFEVVMIIRGEGVASPSMSCCLLALEQRFRLVHFSLAKRYRPDFPPLRRMPSGPAFLVRRNRRLREGALIDLWAVKGLFDVLS
jgi:hypothetical protein